MSALQAIQCDRCGVKSDPRLNFDGQTWLRLSRSSRMSQDCIPAGVHDFCSERCLMMWVHDCEVQKMGQMEWEPTPEPEKK